jgi:hypothetical protein
LAGLFSSFDVEVCDVSAMTSPASTSASNAEKAALRVTLDAPLSMTARWTASMIAGKAWLGIVMASRSLLMRVNLAALCRKHYSSLPLEAVGRIPDPVSEGSISVSSLRHRSRKRARCILRSVRRELARRCRSSVETHNGQITASAAVRPARHSCG